MKATWTADREYIEQKYREMRFDPATGLDNEAIREGLRRILKETKGEQHARIKAKGFAYVLGNARIDISEHDWFVGLSEWSKKSMDGEFCSKWYAEVREICAPLLSELDILHNRAKSHLLYLDYCHSVPDWKAVLRLGFPGLRERARGYRKRREGSQGEAKQMLYAGSEADKNAYAVGGGLTERQAAYFDAIETEYSAILDFLARARDYASSKGNPKCDRIAECLEQLRTGAPRDIYECLQTIWLYFLLSEYVDCLQVRSFGNLDVMLYPYYKNDIESGRYTDEDIRDFFAAFLMQASAMDYYFGHPFYLGGTNADGTSAVNDLSYLILDVYDKLGIFDPKVQVKLNRNTPRRFVYRLLEMIRGGHSSFNFVCEPAIRRTMLSYGYTEEEARTCDIKGCYEFAAAGDEVGTANVHVNFPKAIELALHDGWDFFNGFQSGPHTGRAEDMATFEQFYEAFMAQAFEIYERGFGIINAYESHTGEINPAPMFSATIQTSLERAFDAYSGGAKYNTADVLLCSVATAADSLAMVKKYVYEKRELTLVELRDLLDKNWEGGEILRRRILNDRDKWGNNRDLPDSLMKDFTEAVAKRNNCRRNARGGFCATSLHNAKQFLEMGWKTAATPDGRFSGEECSKNASPVQGMNCEGATALLNSIAKLDSRLFKADFPIDVALSPSAVQGQEGLDAMYALLTAYLENYGHAIHFNVFSPDVLRAAQSDPEKYKDLQIRVCGWNVLWNSMTKDEQEFYIRQAEAAQ
ncbi:MAG: pyruvate formate lyase family protein [Christensenellales bacterium]|jgi:pyruvate-formate lyase